jgi:hypothetical protein
MFGEFSQNYLAQAKESENTGSNILKQSFIKIKDTVSNSSAFFYSEANTTNQPQVYQDLPQSLNVVTEALNQGRFIDPELIDQHISQLWGDINKHLQLVHLLTHRKINQVQPEISTYGAFMNMIGIHTPMASNIIAPKPVHANQNFETARIGRSHSMFVTSNPKINEVSTGLKSNDSEKQFEVVSQLSDKKESIESSNRKRMNVFKCPHTDRKHYAKNMCNN